MNATPALLNKEQLALAIGVSPRQVNVMMATRQIPFLRISPRVIRFDIEKVKNALGAFEQPATGGRR